jgi:iron complex outermembrane receptor protein
MADKYRQRIQTIVGVVSMQTALLYSSAGIAQQQRDANPDATASGDVSEIVVTALRRDESLRTAPAAITAFDQRAIEEARIREPADYLTLTPGVSFSGGETAGIGFITVRGITQNRSGELPVAVVIDGVQQHLAQGFSTQLIDLKQIELLKGPQGALYGRNAAAGAIVISTVEPTDEAAGSADLEMGNGGSHSARATVRGPIIPGELRASVAVTDVGFDGLVDNVYLREKADYSKERSVRGAVFWLPTDGLTIDARAYIAASTGGALNYVSQDVPDANSTSTPINSDILGFQSRHIANGSLRVRYTTPVGLLTSVTSGGDTNIYYTASAYPYYAGRADPGTTYIDERYRNFNQEVRITSDSEGPLKYIAGVSYYHEYYAFYSLTGADLASIVLRGFQGADSINPTLTDSSDLTYKNAYAGFAQLDYKPLQNLLISGAVRYDAEYRRGKNVSPEGFNPYTGLVRRATFAAWQPKITVSYTPTQNVTVYSTYGKGFRPGGFNAAGSAAIAQAQTPPNYLVRDDYLSETNTSYEIGLKTSILDGMLDVNTAVYHQRVRNQQYYSFIVAANTSILSNINKVDVNGGELEARFHVGNNLSIGAAYSLTRSIIKAYSLAPANAGNRAPYVPFDQINLSVEHRLPVTDALALRSRLDYVRLGKEYWDTDDSSPRNPVGLLEGRVALESRAGWSAYLFGKNLTDKRYNENYVEGGFAEIAEPRTYGIGAQYRF